MWQSTKKPSSTGACSSFRLKTTAVTFRWFTNQSMPWRMKLQTTSMTMKFPLFTGLTFTCLTLTLRRFPWILFSTQKAGQKYKYYNFCSFLIILVSAQGIAFINGFNLGRYWPRAGPQRTMLLPGSLLNANSTNRLVVIEFERAPTGCSSGASKNCTIGLVDAPVLDALCGN